MLLDVVSLHAVKDMPEIAPGDDVGALIVECCCRQGLALADGDVVVIAQKIVSKMEGSYVFLAGLEVSSGAEALAAETGKDPRHVEAILRQSRRIIRKRPGTIVVEDLHGFVMANAGLDASNVAGDSETLLALPVDPDGSAAGIRETIRHATGASVGVIINDSWGRPFRMGTVGTAIGVAGIEALRDCRGKPDRNGRALESTLIAVADEVAAAASLLMGAADEGLPVVVVRGLPFPPADGKVSDLLRDPSTDMFREPAP